jgi:outer membrane protein assembly factor BamB
MLIRAGATECFGFIPTLVTVGPLALLALLFPAAFAGLAYFFRRWLVFLCTISLASTVYLAYFWFHGILGDSWFASLPALWTMLAVIAVAGCFYSWRQRTVVAVKANDALPTKADVFVPGIVALVALAIMASRVAHGTAANPGWRELLIAVVVPSLGAVYAASRRLTSSANLAPAPRITTEQIMLCGLAICCASFAVPVAEHKEDESFRVVWTFEPIPRGAIITKPLVTDTHVYVGAIQDTGVKDSGAVYCLDKQTGRMVWKFDDHGAMHHMASSPCLAQGRLYIGDGMHANFVCKLYCLDAESGHKLWDFTVKSHIESTPCVAGSHVFFGAGDDGVYCLDARTGAPRWRFNDKLHVDSSPLVTGGRLYGGAGVSRLYTRPGIFCLDATSGKVIWRHSTELPVWGSAAMEGAHVFFGLGNGSLTEAEPDPLKRAGAVLCVDAGSGETTWSYALSDAVFVRPAVDSKYVCFGGRDGFCYCLDRRGELLWREPMGSAVMAEPALNGRDLYVIATGGRVCRFDADTGKLTWSFDVAAHSRTQPALFSAPTIELDPASRGGHHWIYFGAELKNPATSAAMVYCLHD